MPEFRVDTIPVAAANQEVVEELLERCLPIVGMIVAEMLTRRETQGGLTNGDVVMFLQNLHRRLLEDFVLAKATAKERRLLLRVVQATWAKRMDTDLNGGDNESGRPEC